MAEAVGAAGGVLDEQPVEVSSASRVRQVSSTESVRESGAAVIVFPKYPRSRVT